MSKYQVDGRSGNLIGGNLIGGAVTSTVTGAPTTTTTTYTTTEYIQPAPAVNTTTYVQQPTYTTVPVTNYVTETRNVPVTTYATTVQPAVAYQTGVVSSQVGVIFQVGLQTVIGDDGLAQALKGRAVIEPQRSCQAVVGFPVYPVSPPERGGIRALR